MMCEITKSDFEISADLGLDVIDLNLVTVQEIEVTEGVDKQPKYSSS